MDKMEFEKRVKRIEEINKVVENLDPAVRHDAFLLLAEYVTGKPIVSAVPETGEQTVRGEGDSLEKLISKFGSDKPPENAKLLAAHSYSLYGKAPVSFDRLKDAANESGLIIPERPDNTLRNATKDKKRLFNVKSGCFSPTIHGEKFLMETYGVTRGTLTKPDEEDG